MIDTRYANSSGYFKDPITGDDLSQDTPRIIACELKDGKFVWPMVAASDGAQLLKIVYKYFTKEEKSLYKQYRGRSPSDKEVKERKQKVKLTKVEAEVPITEKKIVKGAASQETLIKQCDMLYGISTQQGVSYALIGRRDSLEIYHILQSDIPDDELQRLYEST